MILQFWLWLGKKLGFRWIDIKCFKVKGRKGIEPNVKEEVEAITFSMTESYINKISKFD